MLLNNYSVLNRNVASDWGIAFSNPMARFKSTLMNNFYCGNHVVTNETNRSAFNNGYNGYYAWWQPLVSGGLGAGNTINGSGDVSAGNLAGGVNGVAALTGSGDITNAACGLIVAAVAALTGSGSLSGDVVGILNAAASLAGAGDLVGSLNALGFATAALTGTGAVDATINAKGTLSADIVVTGDLLSTANVGEAVWSAIAAEFNEPGTMGELANLIANLPTEDEISTMPIEGSFTLKKILRIIAAAVAGKCSGGPTNPVFRNLTDDADRIVGVADADGNRTSATYTP